VAAWQLIATPRACRDNGDAFASLVAILDYWQAQLPKNEGRQANGYGKSRE